MGAPPSRCRGGSREVSVRRAAAPSRLVSGFDDVDSQAGAGQGERGDESVGPGSHDDRVGLPHGPHCRFSVRSPPLPRMTGIGLPGEPAQGAVDLVVGALGSMVEQRDPAGAGRASASPTAYSAAAWPKDALDRHLLGRGDGRRGSGGRRRAPARARPRDTRRSLGARPERRRAVIGDVGQRRTAVAHPESTVRPPCGAPRRARTGEALALEGASRERGRSASRRGSWTGRWGRRAATSCGPTAPRHGADRPRPAGTA